MSGFKKAIGVLRESPFAPLLYKEDSRILEETLRRLGERGLETELLQIQEMDGNDATPLLILNMCEGALSLEKLEKMERKGSQIFNRPEAVRNCYRIRMISMLSEHALPFAKSLLVNLEGRRLEDNLSEGIPVRHRSWLKRGDVHCTQKGDVRPVKDSWELEEGLRDFVRRGIIHGVLQDHLEGDLIKFYAVRNQSFFQCYVQDPDGTKRPYPPGAASLRKISARAAEILGLDVYGGDFVLTSRGPVLIDINAWPSFAPCCEEAANAIAAHVLDVLSTRVKS